MARKHNGSLFLSDVLGTVLRRGGFVATVHASCSHTGPDFLYSVLLRN